MDDNLPIGQNQVEIHASGIDVDEIMTTIRHNIQHRQKTSHRTPINFPEFEELICPEEPADGEHSALLYFLLREMNQTHTPPLQAIPELTPSPMDKLPILGYLWNMLRRHLHGLSIFYTNKLGRQIVTHLRYPVVVLNLMTRLNQKREAELVELKQRVTDLEIQLTRLEQKG